MEHRTLLIIRKPPIGSVDAFEALRLSLSFYAADAPVEILLEGAGVLNWLAGMKTNSKDPLSVCRLVKDIERFDIPVFLLEEDLADYGLNQHDLASLHPKIISRDEATNLLFANETTISV